MLDGKAQTGSGLLDREISDRPKGLDQEVSVRPVGLDGKVSVGDIPSNPWPLPHGCLQWLPALKAGPGAPMGRLPVTLRPWGPPEPRPQGDRGVAPPRYRRVACPHRPRSHPAARGAMMTTKRSIAAPQGPWGRGITIQLWLWRGTRGVAVHGQSTMTHWDNFIGYSVRAPAQPGDPWGRGPPGLNFRGSIMRTPLASFPARQGAKNDQGLSPGRH